MKIVFAENRLLRHLLFLTAAMTSIMLVGYHFGTFDQNIHVPFLKAAVDGTLFPGDRFTALRDEQYSFFWFFFQPFYLWGMLEVSLFFGHLLATYLTFWALWDLSMTLFASPLAALLGVLVFIFPHVGFVGFPVIEFSLLSRTFVLPFLLFAINFYLRRRFLLAFFLLGLMYNLNLLMTNFVVAMLLFTSLVEWRKQGWRTLAAEVAVFFLAALPVLTWKFSQGSGLDWSLRPEWFSVFTRGTIYSIFYLFALKPPMIVLTMGGCCSLGLFFIAYRSISPARAKDDNLGFSQKDASQKSPSGDLTLSRQNRQVCLMMTVIGVIMLIQVISTLWLPVTLIIQLQFLRASLFILIFSYLYFAAYLAQLWYSGELAKDRFAVLTGTFIIGPTPIFPLAAWGALCLPAFRRLGNLTVSFIMVVNFLIFITVMLTNQLWYPGIYVFAIQTPWVMAQKWAKDHTPKEAVFITPPQNYGIYESDWRVFSERQTVTSITELFEIALLPEYFPIWKERFEVLVPGAIEQFAGNLFENQQIIKGIFNSRSAEAFLQAACQFNASYLVVNQPTRLNFPVSYANEGYIVYDLRQVKNCIP